MPLSVQGRPGRNADRSESPADAGGVGVDQLGLCQVSADLELPSLPWHNTAIASMLIGCRLCDAIDVSPHAAGRS